MADEYMNDGDAVPQFQPGALDMGVDAIVSVPVGKLDADQYSADDLDGVTESVFGSGNMAYASLQASQTDAALAADEAADIQSDIVPDGREMPLNTDRPLEIGDTGNYEAMGTQGNYANATVGSLGASALSSDVGSFSPESNLNISGENFFKGSTGSALSSTVSNSNPSHIETSEVSNTYNNPHSESTETYNEYNQYIDNLLDGDLGLQVDLNLLDTVGVGVNVPLTDPLSTDLNLSVDLDPALNLVGTVADLTGIAVVSDAVEQLDSVTDATQDAVNQVTDLVTDLDLRDLDATVEQATDLIANLDDTALNVVQGAGDTVNGLLDVTGLGAGENTIGDTVDSVASDLANIVDMLSGGATSDLSDALIESVDTVTDVVDDLSADTLDNAGETLSDTLETVPETVEDLTGSVEDTTEALTDVVDDVAGDIVDTGAVTDVLGSEGLGLVDTDLGFDNDTGAPGETDNTQGDSDIGLDTGVDLIDNTIVDAGLDTTLDGLENAGSDNDLGIDATVDVLADTADDLLDGDDSAADIIGDIVSDGGGVDEVVQDVQDDVSDALDGVTTDADAGSLVDDAVSTVEDTVSDGADLLAEVTDNVSDDLDLGDTLDLLGGDTADASADTSESTDTSWTESTIDDTSGLFDDVISGGDSSSGDILPDPSGTVSEGLGILDTGTDSGGGSLGGLFG